jgi:type I restriction enzyme S subunit
MPFVFAGTDVCLVFGKMIQPLFTKIRANADMSRTLVTLRDTLLPKLISGELRVKNAERFVAEATA